MRVRKSSRPPKAAKSGDRGWQVKSGEVGVPRVRICVGVYRDSKQLRNISLDLVLCHTATT